MKTILLNPGPVTLSARVRAALSGPDLCHREPEFAALQARIRRGLLEVYGLDSAQWAAILMTGSGTAAVEAMVTSCVPRGGKLLTVENGVYGDRIANIAVRHQIPCHRVEHNWLEPIDLLRVEAALRAHPGTTHVAVVHHETTTGRLNALDLLADLCRARGVGMLVDAVSSFGAELIDFADWPIAGCAATANKCLHGVPGTCFVVCARDRLAAAGDPRRTVYFDLTTYLSNQDGNGTPFTQSVQTFYALDTALAELRDEGGWRQRQRCYRERMGAVRAKLRALGVAPVLDEHASSCVLQGFELPREMGYAALHDALKTRGFVIYAGQSKLAESLFRISMMGDISASDVARLCHAFEEIINRT